MASPLSKEKRAKGLRLVANVVSVLSALCGVLGFFGSFAFTAELGFAGALGMALIFICVFWSITMVSSYILWRTDGV